MQILSIRSKVSSRGFYESLFLINNIIYMFVTVMCTEGTMMNLRLVGIRDGDFE
jgi:hypothetical protein